MVPIPVAIRTHWSCVEKDPSKPVPLLKDCRGSFVLALRQSPNSRSASSSAVTVSPLYRLVSAWLGRAFLGADCVQRVDRTRTG